MDNVKLFSTVSRTEILTILIISFDNIWKVSYLMLFIVFYDVTIEIIVLW